jgi:DNA anti-recombination protein RmuC
MTMESVLKKLESRIEEFVDAHRAGTERISELEAKLEELESKMAASADLSDKIQLLEAQREQLSKRLENVLATIDEALGEADSTSR